MTLFMHDKRKGIWFDGSAPMEPKGENFLLLMVYPPSSKTSGLPRDKGERFWVGNPTNFL